MSTPQTPDFRARFAALPPAEIRPFLVHMMETVVAHGPSKRDAAQTVTTLGAGVVALMYTALTGQKPDEGFMQRRNIHELGMGAIAAIATMPDFPDVPGFPFTQAELRAGWETFDDKKEKTVG